MKSKYIKYALIFFGIAIIIFLVYNFYSGISIFPGQLQTSEYLPHFTDEPVTIKLIQIHTGYPSSYFVPDNLGELPELTFANRAGHYLVQTESGDLLYDGAVIDNGNFEQVMLSDDGKHYGYIKDSGENENMQEFWIDGRLIESFNSNSNPQLYAISNDGHYFYSILDKEYNILLYKDQQFLSKQPGNDGSVSYLEDFQISQDGKFYAFSNMGVYYFNGKKVTTPNNTSFFTFSDNGKHMIYTLETKGALNGLGPPSDWLYIDGKSTGIETEFPLMINLSYRGDSKDGKIQVNDDGKIAAVNASGGVIMQSVDFVNFNSDVLQINNEQTHVLSRVHSVDRENAIYYDAPTKNDYLLDGKPISLPLAGDILADTIIASLGVELYGNTIYVYKFVE